MTRDEFCQICEAADTELEGEPLSLCVEVCRERSLDRAVFLYGSWGKGCLTRRELYRPTPGRQGKDCYQSANAKCEAAADKFNRWLAFYYDYAALR